MPLNSNPSGIVSYNQILDARKKLDIDSKLAILSPNRTGLFSIINKFGKKKPAMNMKYSWDEDEIYPYQTTTTASAAAADTVISVADDIYVPNDIIRVARTEEHMLVTAIDKNAHTVTVVRGYQNTVAADINAADELFEIGNVNSEGSGSVKSKSSIATELYNYCQIFKTSAEITDIAEAQALISGDTKKWNEELKRSGLIHTERIERALLFGKRYIDNANFSYDTTTTGGLFEYITSNVQTDADGTLTRDEFEDWIVNMVLAYKNQFTRNKLVVVGGTIMNGLNHWLDNKTTLNNPEYAKLGMQLKEYRTYKGDVMIYHSSLLDEAGLSGMALGLDVNNVFIRTFKPTEFKDNIQLPDVRVHKAEWYSVMGLEVKSEKTHAILKGVTNCA
jgi:hypothetical protein